MTTLKGDGTSCGLIDTSALEATTAKAMSTVEPVSDSIRYAIDLLTERKYGNPARSPNHNARVILESALAALSHVQAPAEKPYVTTNEKGQIETHNCPVGLVARGNPDRPFLTEMLDDYNKQNATTPQIDEAMVERRFKLGDRVHKSKGAAWQGKVVGFYSTTLTPIGYAVESERETGSVQIYPEAALEAAIGAKPVPVDIGEQSHG
jgi:hypothetical protein